MSTEYNRNDLRSVLVAMRGEFGANVFENPPRMFSILMDLAPGLKRDGNVLRQMSNAGLLRELRTVAGNGADYDRVRVTAKSRLWLTDYLMLPDDKADYFMTALQAAYGLETAPPKPSPVTPRTLPQPSPTPRLVTPSEAPKLPQPVTPPKLPQPVSASKPTQPVTASKPTRPKPAPKPQRVTRPKAAPISKPRRVAQYGPTPLVTPSKPAPSKAGIIDSGRTGECRWTLDKNDVFTVSGQGRMGAYSIDGLSPWREYRDRIKAVIIERGVTSIGDATFEGCAGLKSVTIPDSVTSIRDNAFSGCVGLTRMIIPDSVTAIESWAFSGCSGLTSVMISHSVTSIKSWIFAGCTGLKSVTIPNGVTEIKSSAFSGCAGLRIVTIPDSVTSIKHWAFDGCDSLKQVSVSRDANVDPTAFPPHTQIIRRPH